MCDRLLWRLHKQSKIEFHTFDSFIVFKSKSDTQNQPMKNVISLTKVLLGTSVATLLITGCVSNPEQKSSVMAVAGASSDPLTSQQFSICRPSSIIRSFEKPDVLVNGVLQGVVENGSKNSYLVGDGKKFEVFLASNFLMYRFNDETLYAAKAQAKKQTFIVVTPQTNWAQGLSVAFGGALAESARQSGNSKSDNWTVTEVDSSTFNQACKN